MRRRRLKKIEPLETTDALKPMRKVKGVDAERWCPDWDHRGPWNLIGGLEIPDNATAVGRELLEGTAPQESCDWCGAVRIIDGIELRRRLRPGDYKHAVVVREREKAAARNNKFKFGNVKLVFLLEVSDQGRRHLVGRHKTFCGEQVKAVAWLDWAGAGGRALPTDRCKTCHREAIRITDEQLAVAFAYMLATARVLDSPHKNDNVKMYDRETGRLLLPSEWVLCGECDGSGNVRRSLTEFVWAKCDPCEGVGYHLTEHAA